MNDESKHSLDELEQWRSLPLRVKVMMAKQRIRDWVDEYGEDNVCIVLTMSPEFLVLAHMVIDEFPSVKVRYGSTDLKPIVADMITADDEKMAEDWLETGCNSYDTESPISRPMAYWMKKDVLEYINEVIAND